MAKKRAATPIASEEPKPVEADAAAPATPEKAAKSTEPITLKSRDHEGKPTERVFSAEVHGENYATLAAEFKTTNASRLISD